MSKIAVIGIIGQSVFLPVERFHEGGETVTASSVHFEPGSKGCNQAVAAARCGAEVSFLAAVGTEYRREFADFLDRESISYTPIYKDEPTAFAAIVTDRSGANHVTVYHGAALSARDVSAFADKIGEADILLLNNEVPMEVNMEAIKIAKSHGVKCILNPAPARENDGFVLDNVDLFTPNEHETLGIENKTNVVMTLGKRGCLIKATGERIPAFDSGKAVDTTGAGDTFNGVLAAMLAEGRDIAMAAKIANRVSSLGVTRRYAAGSIPTKEEIGDIVNKVSSEPI
ncbi:MAG: ribokinase [Clostridia bacterium]|nr:ribokinase [Clostridia bacterium]